MPRAFYCQHWDWGYSLFSILYSIPRSQVPSPRSQVPSPRSQSQSLDNILTSKSCFFTRLVLCVTWGRSRAWRMSPWGRGCTPPPWRCWCWRSRCWCPPGSWGKKCDHCLDPSRRHEVILHLVGSELYMMILIHAWYFVWNQFGWHDRYVWAQYFVWSGILKVGTKTNSGGSLSA